MKTSSEIEKFKTYIEDTIDKYNISSEIKDVLRYVLISEGKYIRPLLLLSFLSDNNLKEEDFFDIALCIEMIHTYSLIHDDLPALDNDDYRRGKLSCHKKFGEDVAILAGDMLLTNSFEQVLKNPIINELTKIEILKLIIDASGINGMIFGQYLDVKNLANDLETLDKMHILKTSKMISLPILIACKICNIEPKKEEVKVIEEIGLYYQIQDDYLDVYGENLGKTLNKDLENNKKTYTYYYPKDELDKIIKSKKSNILLDLDFLKKSSKTKNLLLDILERDK